MRTWTKQAENGKTVELRFVDRNIKIYIGGEYKGATGMVTRLDEHQRQPGMTYAKAPRVNAEGEAITHAVYVVMLTEPEGREVERLFAEEQAECLAQAKEKSLARKAKLETTVPGLDELLAAIADRDRYDREFSAMMEDGDNDGARRPKPTKASIADLAARYPRAAMWVKADAYELASHDQKVLAGKTARKLIEAGGSLEEAAEILKNWLPASAMWD